MADAGIADIFLPYNILGEQKLARLKALAARVRLSVTADSPTTVAGLAKTFRRRRLRRSPFSSNATPEWDAAACKIPKRR